MTPAQGHGETKLCFSAQGRVPPSHVLQFRAGLGGLCWGQSSPCRRHCCGWVPECQVTLPEHKGAMCPTPRRWFLKGNDEWFLETTAQSGRERRFSVNTHENGTWIIPATAAAECRGGGEGDPGCRTPKRGRKAPAWGWTLLVGPKVLIPHSP